jgi:hypothetical protein
MRAILMDMNAAHITGIHISSDMVTSVDDEDTFSAVCGLPCKNAPEEASTHHKIIVLFHHASKSPKVVSRDCWIISVVSLPHKPLHPG